MSFADCDFVEYLLWYGDDADDWILIRDIPGICRVNLYSWSGQQTSEYIECLSDGSDVIYSSYDNNDCSGTPEDTELGSVKVSSSGSYSNYTVNCIGIGCEYGIQRKYETESCNQTNIENDLSDKYDDYTIEVLKECEFFYGERYSQYTECINGEELNWSTYDSNECLNSTISTSHSSEDGECDDDQSQTKIICGTANITSYYYEKTTTTSPNNSFIQNIFYNILLIQIIFLNFV